MSLRIGVVGGTGLYEWGAGRVVVCNTEFGSIEMDVSTVGDVEVYFTARHGRGHAVPPHRVNARAQIRAFADAGVDYVLGLFNVGSLDNDFPAGTWLVPDDFLDLTRHRPFTFHDDRAVHADMSEPFCPHGRQALLRSGTQGTRDGGIYATTEGPRFETTAERRALRLMGAHVVGMTLAPEAVLAREAGLCYAALCFIANGAAPLGGQLDPLQIQRDLALQSEMLREWIQRAFPMLPTVKSCRCAQRGRVAALTRPRTDSTS